MNIVSIIIPVFNEVNTIETVLSRVQAAKTPGLKKEIIIVDDCSQDGTQEFLRGISPGNARITFKVIFHEKNTGKGGALHTGFTHANGDIIIVQDADLEYNPDEYKKLLQPILEDRADIVYGSRFLPDAEHRVLNYRHFIGNKILTLLSNIFSNLYLTDMETCYKVFRREYVEYLILHQKRFGIEPEITAKFSKMKIRIYEIAISYSGRSFEEGKKIGLKDAFKAIWCIVWYNIGSLKFEVKHKGKRIMIKARSYHDFRNKLDELSIPEPTELRTTSSIKE